MKLVRSQQFEGVEVFTVGQNPISKPKLAVNLFHVDGLLIDTGPSRMSKEVFRELNTKDIDQIFITHHHEDHTGNVAQLSKHFDCPVYGSDRCADMMKNPPKISFAQYAIWGNRAPYHDIKPTSTLHTKQYAFQLIDVPGHAPDMVALYEPIQKWLFTADLYVHHYISYFLFSESVAQQIQSLEKVLQLDFETLFCCHIPPIKDGREKLTRKLNFLKEFEQAVREQATKGHNAQRIMRELKLKERWGIRLLSHGMLSQLNMVKSVLNDMKAERVL